MSTKDFTSGSKVLPLSACLFHTTEELCSDVSVKLITVHGHNLNRFIAFDDGHKNILGALT